MPSMKVKCLDAAQEIGVQAALSAPVESGDYARSITAEITPGGARVVSHDAKASWIEFGAPNAGQEARWVIRNAAENLGYKFKRSR